MKAKALIKTLSLKPSRTIDFGPGKGFAKLSVGLELEFDKPVGLDSPEVQEALNDAHKFITEEFKAQYKPYQKVNKK
jgi:hypothetical protein